MACMNQSFCSTAAKLSCINWHLYAQAMQDGTVLKPADHDRVNFKPDWSVDFWREFAVAGTLQSDNVSVATK